MTPRARRLATVAAVLGLLVLIAGAGVWWMFDTEPGAKWGFARLGAFFPGRLDVTGLSGPLRGPLIVRHFAYRNDRLAITADSVYIDWRLRELWRRRLDIHRLYAVGAHVIYGAPGSTPEASDSLRGLPDVNLPVTVILRDARVDSLTLATAAKPDSGFLVDRVRLDARSARHDSLRVNALEVRSKLVDLDFSGAALPRGGYPLALSGQWTYRMPGHAPVHGEGTLSGSLDTLRVRQHLTGPFDARVDLSLFRPLRIQRRYRGDLEFARFVPRGFDPAWPAGSFSGRVGVEGNERSGTATGSISGTTEALGPTRADFRIRSGGSNRVAIDQLVLTRPGTPGRLSAHGILSGAPANARFDLAAEWASMGWPLRGEPLVVSQRGSARVQGTPDDFGIQLQALLSGRNLPPGHWTLDGRGGRRSLAVRTVIANVVGGRIVGRGSVAWQPTVRWNLAFDANGVNPGAIWPAYPGALAFTGRSEGTNGPAGPSGRILVTRLSGTLRGQPVAASGALSASRGQYRLSNAAATWGPNRVEASGGFGRAMDLSWKLDAPRLGAALAQSSGSVRGQGTIRGTRTRPHLAFTLTGDSLYVARARAAALRADGDLDLRPGGPVRLDVTATGVSGGDQTTDRLIVAARGTRERNQWRASVGGRLDSMVVALAGGFENGGWTGQLTTLDLVNPRSGNWSLVGPARLTAGGERVALSGFTWGSGTSRIHVAADWTRRGPWHLDSRLEAVNLALLQPQLPPRLRLSGTMDGHAMAHGTPDGRVFADVDVAPAPGTILYQNAAGQWVPTRFENASLRATADGRRVQSTLTADLVNVGTVRGSLGWPAYGSFAPGTSRPLDGRLALHLRDLGLAQGFTPELDATSGALDADLTIAGTVDDPFLYGPLTVRNGAVNVPRYGLELADMNVEGRGSPGGAIVLHGSVRSGTGTLAIDGTAAVARGARPVATVTLKGDRIQAMNTEDMQVVASPDLKFSLDGKRLDVTGDVTVPSGHIDIGRADEPRLVKTSPDVVFTGADTLSGQPAEVHTHVRLVLGDQVRVTGFGMDVHPTGSVIVTEAPGLPPLGSGRFDVKDGTYQIYGQDLAIESGSLIFGGGPITNPGVTARATRTADDGTVAGFLVSGTAMHPVVQVFSEPAMGQSEALSYIMYGKPIEQANLSQGQIASTMATTMGVPGTNLLAQGIASSLGIEQAKVNVGTSLQSTSLSLGTHLSPKLYVSAGMDALQSTSTVRVRYILNRIFTLEAETSRQNRVDLLYTVER